VRWPLVLATFLLVAGAALIVLAVLERTAQFALVVFVPVFFSTSWELPAGTLIVLAGIITALSAWGESPGAGPSDRNGRVESTAGGVVVIGPIPIFFGGARRLSRRTRWLVTILCVALFVGLLVVLWFIA
jgi:uncharacterized membrane protein